MKQLFSLLAAVFLIGCSNPKEVADGHGILSKLLPELQSKDQIYTVDASEESILTDPSGSTLIIPANTFEDEEGNLIRGDIQLKFNVLGNSSQILLNGFTSELNDQEQIGLEEVVQISAQYKNQNVRLRSGKSLSYFGTSSQTMVNGELENGKFRWKNKVESEKYLTTVPLSELSFVPVGLESTIEKYLPFLGYDSLTTELRDSLYYSLSARYYHTDYVSEGSDDVIYYHQRNCGANPALIKALKDSKFENTLVATKEFESRVQAIHKMGHAEILEVYLKNLDMPLWKIDSMAAVLANSCEKEVFNSFAAQKLGRVEKRISASKYYETIKRKKANLENQIRSLENAYQVSVKRDEEKLKALQQEYDQMLIARREYRLEKLGWYAIGTCYTSVKMNYTVKRQEAYDQVYYYLVLPEIKSIWAAHNEEDLHRNDFSFQYKSGMLIRGIVIAKKAEQLYFGSKDFYGSDSIHLDLALNPISQEDLNKELSFQRTYKAFNKITQDMSLRSSIKKQNAKVEENHRMEGMMQELKSVAFYCPCCSSEANAIRGKELFEGNCLACHRIGNDWVGPDLAFVGRRMSTIMFSRWVRNSQQLIRTGDPYAMALYEKYNNTEMTAFPAFEDCEIEAMFQFIENQSRFR
ncbi:MAG: cytochrome c [Cytophagaceae bacterium]|jgi:hypothetical protein|nr:cytochrome c [Cytophagaceae bacterium]